MMQSFPSALNERFRPVRLIGSGGYGSVWLAHQRELDRPVAVKTLHAGLTGTDDRRRFEDEARLTSTIRHPGVVTLLDYGVDGDVPWMAFEFVNGDSLREWVRRGPAPWREVVEVAQQVALALEEARRLGVVHRDMKPDNILACGDRRYKVADFGIAKWGGSSVHTQAGLIMGTPAYISPQQVRGLVPAHQSDLYALGITMFELLTGTPPFLDDNPAITLERQLTAVPPDVRTLAPDAPAGLAAIVAKLLAKPRAERYQTAAELAADLGALLREPDSATSRTGLRRPRPLTRSVSVVPRAVPDAAPPRRWALLTVPLAVLTVVGAFALARRPAPPPVAPSPSARIAVAPDGEVTGIEREALHIDAEAEALLRVSNLKIGASDRADDGNRALDSAARLITRYVRLLERAARRVGPPDDRLLVLEHPGSTLIEVAQSLLNLAESAATFSHTPLPARGALTRAVHALAERLTEPSEHPEVHAVTLSLAQAAHGLDAAVPFASAAARSEAALVAAGYLRSRAAAQGGPLSLEMLAARAGLLDRAFYGWWSLRRRDGDWLSESDKPSTEPERRATAEMMELAAGAAALEVPLAGRERLQALVFQIGRACLVRAEDRSVPDEQRAAAVRALVALLLRPGGCAGRELSMLAWNAPHRLRAVAGPLHVALPEAALGEIEQAAAVRLDTENSEIPALERLVELRGIACEQPGAGDCVAAIERIAELAAEPVGLVLRFKARGPVALRATNVVRVAGMVLSGMHPRWLAMPAARVALERLSKALAPLAAIRDPGCAPAPRVFAALLAAAREGSPAARKAAADALLAEATALDRLGWNDGQVAVVAIGLCDAARRLAPGPAASEALADRGAQLREGMLRATRMDPRREAALQEALEALEELAFDGQAPAAARRRALAAADPLVELARRSPLPSASREQLEASATRLASLARAQGLRVDGLEPDGEN